MPIGFIKLVKKDLNLIPIRIGEEILVEGGLYYIEGWENMEVILGEEINLMTIIFPFNGRKYEFNYRNGGIDRIYFESEYNGKLGLISFNCRGKFSSKKIENLNYYNIDRLFLDSGFKKFYISNDLYHLRNKVKFSYGLEYNYEGNEKTLIFGVYNRNDINFLRGCDNCGILWGGSDIIIDSKIRGEVLELIRNRNCINYAMSKRLNDKMVELGLNNIKRVIVSFCWDNLNYRIRELNSIKKRSIYIYDGLDKGPKKRVIYNQELVEKVIETLNGEYKIYRSSDGFREDIINLYKDSFISLRLTEYDGNANSAHECGMLGIPVISNQNMNHCISWRGKEEILGKIKYIYDRNVKIYWEKKGVNLLFISNDLPGKGGGATFTGYLCNYLEERGFNIWEIYLVHSDKSGTELNNRRFIVRFNHKRKLDFNDWIEKAKKMSKSFENFVGEGFKILLRSSVSIDGGTLNKYKIIFMSPGIYKNDYEGDFEVKYVNAGNLKTANMFDAYANSALTQKVFHKFGLTDMKLLEINLLQVKEYREVNERDIDFIFVVSNMERKIKNAKLFLELAKKINRRFMFISAEPLKRELDDVEVVINPENLNKYYRRAKCLINCSYFDSMSNVVLEALTNGCHVLVSRNNGVVDYIKDDIRSKFVVETYKIIDWEDKMMKVIRDWDKMMEDRRRFIDTLRRKSWEVEIRLLELLSR